LHFEQPPRVPRQFAQLHPVLVRRGAGLTTVRTAPPVEFVQGMDAVLQAHMVGSEPDEGCFL
jgi:hypothetical protein